MLKTLIALTALVLCLPVHAAKEWPSWGVTQSQFETSEGVSRLQQIGKEARKSRLKLTITAPESWHSKIRQSLNLGNKDEVNAVFRDTALQSIAITSERDTQSISAPQQNNTTYTARKQVVVDKPVIDSDVEKPDFDVQGITDYSKDNDILKNEIANMEFNHPVEKSKVKIVKQSPAEQTTAPAARNSKEYLQLKYANNSVINNAIESAKLVAGDELFVKDDAILVKRLIHRGRYKYYWLLDGIDLTASGVKQRDEDRYRIEAEYLQAEAETTPKAAPTRATASVNVGSDAVVPASARPTQQPVPGNNTPGGLMWISANDSDYESRREVAKKYAAGKVIERSMKVEDLERRDKLFVKDSTVLVRRIISRGEYTYYYWLDGDINLQDQRISGSDGVYMVEEDF